MDSKKALEIGHKVIEDIGFDWWDKDDERGVTSRLITIEMDKEYNADYWLVSFPYGKEDYGRNVRYHIAIIDSTEKAIDISYRNGYIKLGINNKGKYFIAERRP